MSYNNIAANGRYGDTELRMIDGEPAHVNEVEAHWIDNYGPLGVAATKALGSGTTNPDGYKEYFWPQVASAALQVGGMLYDAHKQKDADASNLEAHMAPYQANIDTLNNRAQSMIQPDSAYNIAANKQIEQNAYDAMGVQNLLSGRAINQGGVGGYSGITEQWAKADLDRRNQQLQSQLDSSLLNRQSQGYNLLGDVGKMQSGLGQMKMQRDMSMPQANIGQMVGQLGAGLFDTHIDNYAFDSNPLDSIETPNWDKIWDNMFPSFGGGGSTSSTNTFSVAPRTPAAPTRFGNYSWLPSFMSDDD